MNESLETKINNTIEQYKTICKLEPNNHKVRVDFAIFYTQLMDQQKIWKIIKSDILESKISLMKYMD